METIKRTGRLALYFITAFLTFWSVSILTISMVYVEKMLRPSCSNSLETPQGFDPITLELPDQVRLKGWWHPPDNGVAVVVLGGLGASRDSMLPTAVMLVKNGYGALTLDYRHCAGRTTTLGYRETEELDAMIAFARSQPGVYHTAVLGFSVGGAAALLGAAENIGIEAVIAEGNYINLEDEITASPAVPFSLQWQIQRAVLIAYRLRTGISPAQISPIEAIPKISPRPILFIHGEKEIARTRGREQFAAAGTAQLWVVPAAGHGEPIRLYPLDYERRIVTFLAESFPQQ